MNNLKFIDLFAGVGGFHATFHQFADCVMACEWDKNARITYLANWEKSLEKNNATFFSDITKIDYSLIPDFSIEKAIKLKKNIIKKFTLFILSSSLFFYIIYKYPHHQ